MNTRDHGQVSFVIFKTPKSKEYVGFCYDFAIVLQNKDPEKLREDLLEAARGYVEAIAKNNLPNKLLNKHNMLPEEYQLLYEVLEKRIARKRVRRELSKEYEEIVDTGRAQLAVACV